MQPRQEVQGGGPSATGRDAQGGQWRRSRPRPIRARRLHASCASSVPAAPGASPSIHEHSPCHGRGLLFQPTFAQTAGVPGSSVTPRITVRVHDLMPAWWGARQDSQRAASTDDVDEDACSDCISVSKASHHAQHHHLSENEDSVMQVMAVDRVHTRQPVASPFSIIAATGLHVKVPNTCQSLKVKGLNAAERWFYHCLWLPARRAWPGS